MSVRAAISFKTFKREMGMETSIRVTISEARDLLTPPNEQAVQSPDDKDKPDKPSHFANDAEAENKFRRSYLVGGGGGVSGHDEMRGNIQEAESTGYGRQNVQYSCDSCFLFG